MATHSSILAWRIPMGRGAWRATVCGVTESQTGLKWLSSHTCQGPWWPDGCCVLLKEDKLYSASFPTLGVLFCSDWVLDPDFLFTRVFSPLHNQGATVNVRYLRFKSNSDKESTYWPFSAQHSIRQHILSTYDLPNSEHWDKYCGYTNGYTQLLIPSRMYIQVEVNW